MNERTIKKKLKEGKILIWKDPSPIEENEYKINKAFDFEEETCFIIYGENSEAEVNYNEIKELGKEEYKSPHIEWVASELDDWAETFDESNEDEDLEVGAETHEEVSERICGYAQKIRNDETLTKEETDEIFFHLWQKSHEQEEEQ